MKLNQDLPRLTVGHGPAPHSAPGALAQAAGASHVYIAGDDAETVAEVRRSGWRLVSGAEI